MCRLQDFCVSFSGLLCFIFKTFVFSRVSCSSSFWRPARFLQMMMKGHRGMCLSCEDVHHFLYSCSLERLGQKDCCERSLSLIITESLSFSGNRRKKRSREREVLDFLHFQGKKMMITRETTLFLFVMRKTISWTWLSSLERRRDYLMIRRASKSSQWL